MTAPFLFVLVFGTLPVLILGGGLARLLRNQPEMRDMIFRTLFALLLLIPPLGLVMPRIALFTAPPTTAVNHTEKQSAVISIPIPIKEVPVSEPVTVITEPVKAVSKPITATSNHLLTNHAVAEQTKHSRYGFVVLFDQLPAALFTVWLIGMVPGLFLLLRSRYLYAGIVKRSEPLQNPVWNEIGTELQTQLGIRRSVRYFVSNEINIPQVVGLFRPSILFPAKYLDGMLNRAVLIHELSHIRRNDLVWQLAASFVCLLYWFQPVVWFCTTAMRTVREELCDNQVLRFGEKAADYAAVLLDMSSVLQRGFPIPHRIGCAVITPQTQNHIERRILLLLNTTPRKESMTMKTKSMLFITLTAAALFAVPFCPALETDKKPEQKSVHEEVSPPTAVDTAPTKPFIVTVLGPDQKPLPGFAVEFSAPFDKSKGVLKGRLEPEKVNGNDNLSWPQIITDENGQFGVEVRQGDYYQVVIRVLAAGYAPFYWGWTGTTRVPNEFTVSLDAGISIGGIVTDDKGKPIKDADVMPTIKTKSPQEDGVRTHMVQKIKTDAEGKWRVDYVPASAKQLFTLVAHSEFAHKIIPLPVGQFQIHGNEEPTQKTVLEPGLVINGKIVDEQGKPIVGVYVRISLHYWSEFARETQTDQDGKFRLIGGEDGNIKLIISSKGYTPTMKQVEIESQVPTMTLEDIILKPGKTVRIRVVDQDGKPCPQAQITPSMWDNNAIYREDLKYFGLDYPQSRADNDGVWVWNDAPEGKVQYIIAAANRTIGFPTLESQSEEHLVTLFSLVSVSGKVTDAKTGKPITNYKLIPVSNGEYLDYRDAKEYQQSDFTFAFNSFSAGKKTQAVRIEVPGYRVAQSREIKMNEGNVHFDFALEPAKNIEGIVYLSGNKPASGAAVMLSTKGSEPHYDEGNLYVGSQGTPIVTDKEGRFSFPNPGQPFALTAVLDGQFATDWQQDFDAAKQYKLELISSRLEGTLLVNRKPAAGITITFNKQSDQQYIKEINEEFKFELDRADTVTDNEGKFIFEHLPAGKGFIGHQTDEVPIQDAPLELLPGRTTVIQISLDKLEEPEPFRPLTETTPRSGVEIIVK